MSSAAAHAPAAGSPPVRIDALLAPLPEETLPPPPENQDDFLSAIEEARREDDPAIPRGVWERALKKADWREVVALSTTYLSQRGKSLRVATILLEGLVRLHGFAGVAPGLDVIAGLCERYWPELQPLPDEDGDVGARLNLIMSLNKRLPLLLASLPLTHSGPAQAGKAVPCWDDYQRAVFASKARLRQGVAAKPGEDSAAAFEAAVAEAPTAVLHGIRHQLSLAESSLEHVQTALLTVCSDERPSLGGAAQTIAEIRNWTEMVLRNRGALASEPEVELEQGGDEEEAWEEPEEMWHGPHFSGRHQAYAMLSDIADYLAATEPHSPTPYLLRRAVAWGNMPLHELLAELSQGRNDLATVFSMLGITSQK